MNTKYAKKATLYINPTIHKLLKIKAAVADETISDITNDLLEAYFESSDEKLLKKIENARKEADAGKLIPFEKVVSDLG